MLQGNVKVGVLHSRRGTLAISGNTVAEAELMGIDETNAAGGIQINDTRYTIVAVEEDGQSDPNVFARRLERLIDIEQVTVVFGGWTSASRKAMLPVVEQRDHRLFYPIQYEGEECSKNIFYAGAAPNQQVEPAVEWLLEHRGRRFFLLGSDYVYPRTVNRIITHQLGGVLAGEAYIPLGDTNVDAAIAVLREALPQGCLVINTINGDSNLAFFVAMHDAGMSVEHGYTVMSFSVAEEELFAIAAEYLQGTFAAWNFFQSLESERARQFSKRFQDMHGIHRVTNDPAAAA